MIRLTFVQKKVCIIAHNFTLHLRKNLLCEYFTFQIKIVNPNIVKLQKFHLQREKYIIHHVKTFVQL
jgi:hypothetical protein